MSSLSLAHPWAVCRPYNGARATRTSWTVLWRSCRSPRRARLMDRGLLALAAALRFAPCFARCHSRRPCPIVASLWNRHDHIAETAHSEFSGLGMSHREPDALICDLFVARRVCRSDVVDDRLGAASHAATVAT